MGPSNKEFLIPLAIFELCTYLMLTKDNECFNKIISIFEKIHKNQVSTTMDTPYGPMHSTSTVGPTPSEIQG